MEQLDEIPSKTDMALIREIYQLTHDAKVMNSPELQAQLAERIEEAERRNLL